MLTINDVLFFDVETTGLPEKGQKYETDYMVFPHIVSIAWSFQGKEKDYIIKPDGWEIPESASKIHGITTEIAMSQGEDLQDVLHEFFMDAEDAPLICAHNLYFDSSIIKANQLRLGKKEYYDSIVVDALSKEKRIDTMMKTIKFVNAKYPDGRGGKWPKLEELHEKLFPGETFDAHDALEDVLALKRCLPELVKLGIIELKQKEYPTEQTKMDFKNPEITVEKKGNNVVVSGEVKLFGVSPKSKTIGNSNPLLDENDF